MAAKTKKAIFLRDMLTKPAGAPRTREDIRSLDVEEPECPVTRTFLETLFSLLQADLQAIKRDLSSDLQEV
ncbi:hypothetical protein NDU88_003514 [Pleurodeles waltl]|uniref:Uncharacterized protein n=1 Tax=Pleurodeles waltl TaxID=8319 RepID=A0AAV7Q9L6_PLEWA|nr:hypothetical protein NDU88_003514 [Pleurodeles waltl]